VGREGGEAVRYQPPQRPDHSAETAATITRLKERIKRLEEAGDKAIENSYYPDRVKVWTEAKEAKS
jgi:hypothetical protein